VIQILQPRSVFSSRFYFSALVFLIKGQNRHCSQFLEETLKLQPKTGQLESFKPSRGLMPASFKIGFISGREYLKADFGNHAIGRVAPADACLWWIIHYAPTLFQPRYCSCWANDFQEGIRVSLELCWSPDLICIQWCWFPMEPVWLIAVWDYMDIPWYSITFLCGSKSQYRTSYS